MTKILPCRFKQSFGPFNVLTVLKCSYTGLFQHLSNPAFFPSVISEANNFRGSSLFQRVSNFMSILEMQKKVQKIFFDFEVIAFELVSLNCRFY